MRAATQGSKHHACLLGMPARNSAVAAAFHSVPACTQAQRLTCSCLARLQGFACPERKGIADFLQEVTSRRDQEVSDALCFSLQSDSRSP